MLAFPCKLSRSLRAGGGRVGRFVMVRRVGVIQGTRRRLSSFSTWRRAGQMDAAHEHRPGSELDLPDAAERSSKASMRSSTIGLSSDSLGSPPPRPIAIPQRFPGRGGRKEGHAATPGAGVASNSRHAVAACVAAAWRRLAVPAAVSPSPTSV